MRIPSELSFLLVLPLLSCAYPTFESNQIPFISKHAVRPLVLWHGLGDSHSSPGMLEVASMIKDVHPGIFVHSVYIDDDLGKDRQAGFYGNVNEQVDGVAEQLSAIDELSGGFDAIGFSQGGQFLRAYVERYNTPPVHNLITFGSQHMGIADLPLCRPGDFLCQIALRAARAGIYTAWAQRNLVQAQYFRDPANLPTYLASNQFLTSINNEVPELRNATYAENLESLSQLVLVMFSHDKTVVPKESAWFGSYAPPSEDDDDDDDVRGSVDKTIVPMRRQPLYLEDTIGLRALDEAGRVVLETCEGEHMQLSKDCWEPLIARYVGGHIDMRDVVRV